MITQYYALVCENVSGTYMPGYTVYANGTTATYILGVNATKLPAGLVGIPVIAYVPIISLALALFVALLLIWGEESKAVRFLAIVLLTTALLINWGLSTPLVTTTMSCLVVTTGKYAVVTISVPNPYYSLAHIANVALAIALVTAAVIEAWYYLIGK